MLQDITTEAENILTALLGDIYKRVAPTSSSLMDDLIQLKTKLMVLLSSIITSVGGIHKMYKIVISAKILKNDILSVIILKEIERIFEYKKNLNTLKEEIKNFDFKGLGAELDASKISSLLLNIVAKVDLNLVYAEIDIVKILRLIYGHLSEVTLITDDELYKYRIGLKKAFSSINFQTTDVKITSVDNFSKFVDLHNILCIIYKSITSGDTTSFVNTLALQGYS